MRSKLFIKFFFPMALIILVSLTAMMLIMTSVFNKYLAESSYKSLKKACDAVSDFTEMELAFGEDLTSNLGDYLYYITSNISDVTNFDMIITDALGRVRSCSCDEWKANQSCIHSGKNISQNLIRRVQNSELREMNTLGIYPYPHFVYAKSVKHNGTFAGTVFATAPLSVTRSMIRTTTKYYLLSAIIPLIIIFFAIYAMTYRLTRPLKQMSRAAQAMAKGDFSKRIAVTRDDEIGELAVSFNQMTNSLAQLEKMRRSFVANVSHELKTPMTTIGGFIDGIIDGTIETQKQSYYLHIVSDEVKRLSRLVESMLDIAKLESGEFILKPELFDFDKLLLDIVIRQEQRIEQKNINIIGLDLLPQVQLTADYDLIYQAIYNLTDNAIKFTDDGGTVNFDVKTDGKKLFFAISNTGKGIPADSLPYVFERFYKVDKSRSANKNSTGLGLYLGKTIIRSHGGTITVSSTENVITTFEIMLPLN